MKALVTNSIILASVVIATAMYITKTAKQTDDIDRIEQGLSGLKTISLPSSIGFKTEANNDEAFIHARLALAPLHLSYKENGMKDTILLIQTINNTDSNLTHYTHSRNILWQNKDDKYLYSLSVSKSGAE